MVLSLMYNKSRHNRFSYSDCFAQSPPAPELLNMTYSSSRFGFVDFAVDFFSARRRGFFLMAVPFLVAAALLAPRVLLLLLSLLLCGWRLRRLWLSFA